MRIGILGTGMVGRALAEGFTRTGNEVSMGTRDMHTTKVRQLDGPQGSMADWFSQNPSVALSDFASVAGSAEVVVNAISGSASLDVLTQAGAVNLSGKVLIDVSNPLDFSNGFPPTLSVSNTDSLAELVQRSFPDVRVVKTLNTLNAALMTNPDQLPEPTTVFLSGDDAGAKAIVDGLLRDFGWTDILDLGDIATARGPEMWLPLWLSAMGALGNPMFNLRVVR